MGTHVIKLMEALAIQVMKKSTRKEWSNGRSSQERFNREGEHLIRGKGRHISKVNIIFKGKEMFNTAHQSLTGQQQHLYHPEAC